MEGCHEFLSFFFNTHAGPSSNLLQFNTEHVETFEFNSPK